MIRLYTNPEYKALIDTITKRSFTRSEEVQESYNKHLEAIKDPNNYIIKIMKDKDQWLTPNEYPYQLPDFLSHYVLWQKEESDPIPELISKFGNQLVFVFVNETKSKSVKKIDHYHIFLDKGRPIIDM